MLILPATVCGLSVLLASVAGDHPKNKRIAAAEGSTVLTIILAFTTAFALVLTLCVQWLVEHQAEASAGLVGLGHLFDQQGSCVMIAVITGAVFAAITRRR